MKKLNLSIVLLAISGLLVVGCSGTTQSPVEPTGRVQQVTFQANSVQSPTVALDKKGPIVHKVQGSANEVYNGKNMVWTIAAHEYSDGTFGGEYEINAANALDEKLQKWNGEVKFLNVYGNIAVVGGVEKTGSSAGWYDVFFVIDNGKNGQATLPDQTSMYVQSLPDLATAQIWWNKAPSELMDVLGVMPVDRGNITVE